MSAKATTPAAAELFERWLDEHPGRRESHEKHSPERQRQNRARVARMFALRASAVAADLNAVVLFARQLQEAVDAFIGTHEPDAASPILAAAGLDLPHPDDFMQDNGANAFEEAHLATAKLAKRLSKFLGTIQNEVWFLLPTQNESAVVREAAA